uniref:Uncharacterized protein n=1 Tax=Fagus sylvatica TaxID=28930 RepID=A0A2N9F3I7_FAGSY
MAVGPRECEHELESLAKDEARRHGEAWRGTAKLGPREPRARARTLAKDEARRHGEAWRGTGWGRENREHELELDEGRRTTPKLARHGEAWRGVRGPEGRNTSTNLGFWFSDSRFMGLLLPVLGYGFAGDGFNCCRWVEIDEFG